MSMDTRVDRVVDKNQWYDPCLLMAGNGSEDFSRWATKFLYANIVDFDKVKSEDWPKYGIITQFDRKLEFNLVNGEPVPDTIPTNNRNWLLLSRAATVLDLNGNNLSLTNFNVSITVPTTTFLMDDQPVSNTFGSGEWPHVMYFPEEWTQNVPRTVTATNKTGVPGQETPANLFLNFKFLQVRTN